MMYEHAVVRQENGKKNRLNYYLQDDMCQCNILETGCIFTKDRGMGFGCGTLPDYKGEHIKLYDSMRDK